MAETTVDDNLVDRFFRLFKGNKRSFGQYDPAAVSKSKALTVKSNFTEDHVRAHLDGDCGLGVVPILDDGKCWWAAIDIDTHGPNGQNVDVLAIEQKSARLGIPVLVCRSKSGGAHCYTFFKEPQDASTVRLVLARWEAQLGYPGAEIFPKQSQLMPRKGDTELPLGNWINLPYFDMIETNRFCVEGGKQVTLEHFIQLAEGRACTLIEYEKEAFKDYDDGPPCLQTMMQARVDEGGRNNAVFQAAIYLKRAFPDEWRPRLDLFNRIALVTPLDQREVRQITGSVARRDYYYKCREEPCRSACQREVCLTKKFGIKDQDEEANGVPIIDRVEKIIGTPVTWRLTIQGKRIDISTDELFGYEKVRQRVFEKLHIVMPMLKRNDWEMCLRQMILKVEEVSETTVEDVFLQRVVEFCRRVRADKNDPEEMRRDSLRRGMPALIGISATGHGGDKKWFYAFKLLDFIEYLKRRRALNFPDHQVSLMLSNTLGAGAKKDKIRAGGTVIPNVWLVPLEMVEEEKVPELIKQPEF